MSEEESAEEPSLSEIIKQNARPWNSFWFWRDKSVGERGAAQEVLKAAGIVCEALVSRAEGQDPPDCEALVEGRLTGIEVTELVHESTLRRSLKAQKQRAQGQDPEKPEAYVGLCMRK